jgi:mannose-1-phosphate guanylyltransferase/mannose-6-phosphate isomerase
LQSHDYKIEANYVIEGKAKVILENDKGEMEEFVFGPGQGWEVPLKRKHRVVSLEAYTALEVSTAHLDDVIRYKDDYNRKDGKIESEHSS